MGLVVLKVESWFNLTTLNRAKFDPISLSLALLPTRPRGLKGFAIATSRTRNKNIACR